MVVEPFDIVVKDTSLSMDLLPVMTGNNSKFSGAGISTTDFLLGMETIDIVVKDNSMFNLDEVVEEVNIRHVIAHGLS